MEQDAAMQENSMLQVTEVVLTVEFLACPFFHNTRLDDLLLKEQYHDVFAQTIINGGNVPLIYGITT